jgi:hypothetical protein
MLNKTNITSKLSVIVLIIASLYACKNESSKQAIDLEENRSKSFDQNDGLITIKGNFIYHQDAAVLQTQNEVYHVVVDDKMKELNELVQPYKKVDTDMIPVTIRVRRFEKPADEEGWPFRLEIKDILKVETPQNQEDVIKLAN